MKTLFTNTVVAATAAALVWFAPRPAEAQALNLNVCEKLLQDLFIPPTYKDVLTCNMPSNAFAKLAYCTGLPHCCVPGMCLADPVCYTKSQIQTAAGYWKHRGDIHCSIQSLSPRNLVEKILTDQLVNAVDLLTANTIDMIMPVVGADMDVLYARAKPIPQAWQTYLSDLIAPIYDNGATGFARSDLPATRIISNTDALAKMWLKDGMDAITLGNVVVVRSSTYDVIMNKPISSSAHSTAQLSAAQLLAHEMVHVKQYRTLGRTRFLKEYLIQNLLINGGRYCRDTFEQEAYSFGARLAEVWGGEFCTANVAFHNQQISTCGLSRSPVSCNTQMGVCGTGASDCTRKATTLHRMALTCNGTPLNWNVQDVDVRSGSYSNFTCTNRHKSQCIDDGSFDAFYMEWCDFASPTCKQISPREYACDPGAKPSGTCKVSKLHRAVLSCNGSVLSPERTYDLATQTIYNYKCANRFNEQCVQDGSFDSYYSEWCEYACE